MVLLLWIKNYFLTYLQNFQVYYKFLFYISFYVSLDEYQIFNLIRASIVFIINEFAVITLYFPLLMRCWYSLWFILLIYSCFDNELP